MGVAKGTCGNNLRIRQDVLEAAVLNSLEKHLMDPALCEQFCAEYVRHMNELRRTHNAALSHYQAELARLDKDIERMIKAICDGFANKELKVKFNAADARKKELRKLIDEADEAPSAIQPRMAERYRKEVGRLVATLNDKQHRTEASSLIRDLIDRIVLTPNAERSELMIDLHGDLAGILAIANGGTQKAAPKGGKAGDRLDSDTLDEVVAWAQIKMVAGAGFEPAAFRL